MNVRLGVVGPAREGVSPLRAAVPAALLSVTAWLAARNLVLWLDYGRAHLGQTDFALYYAFSKIGLAHGWGSLYDLGAQRAVYESMPGTWWFPLPFAPPMAWLTAPLTALPLAPAYWTWCAILALAFLGCWWLATPPSPVVRAVCLAGGLSPYLSLLGLELGQFVVVQLLAVAAAVWLLGRGRPVLAGLSLVALDLHPQGFFLVPAGLLLFGARRTVVTWAAASAVLALAAAATLGAHGVEQYLQRLALAERSPAQFYVSFPVDLPLMVHGRGPKLAAMVVPAALSLVAAWRRRGGRVEPAVAATLIGSVLSTSFVHLDDLMALVLAGWLILRLRMAAASQSLLVSGLAAAVALDFERVQRYGWLLVLFEVVWLVTLTVDTPPS